VAGDETRRQAARLEEPAGSCAHGQNRGLRVFSQRQAILGAVENDAAERLPERRIGLVERLAADGVRVGKGLPHPDRLRSLSWKNEGDHVWLTAAAAMSFCTRSMKVLAANR
jgi:hypothetical protein